MPPFIGENFPGYVPIPQTTFACTKISGPNFILPQINFRDFLVGEFYAEEFTLTNLG